jgi:hypothetical protein
LFSLRKLRAGNTKLWALSDESALEQADKGVEKPRKDWIIGGFVDIGNLVAWYAVHIFNSTEVSSPIVQVALQSITAVRAGKS